MMERIDRFLKEPLLHFLLIGGAFFALYSAVGAEPAPPRQTIIVDESRVNALAAEYELVWKRPPSPEELDSAVEAWVKEEVLYREGVALGLDEDDKVVRRRVVQKMQFLAEGMASNVPTEKEVATWFSNHQDDYLGEAKYSLTQIYIDPKKHKVELNDVIEQARTQLGSDGQSEIGDSTLLPHRLEGATPRVIERDFGKQFSRALQSLPVGEWVGPIESSFGLHLVQIQSRSEPTVPPLSEIQKTVERDLVQARTKEAVATFYRTARQRYDLERADGTKRDDPSIQASKREERAKPK